MNTEARIKSPAHWLAACQLLDTALIEQVCGDAAASNKPLVQYLVDQQLLDSKAIACAASKMFRLPMMDLDALDFQSIPATAITPALIRKHHVLPLWKRDDRILLGLADPACEEAVDEIKFHTGCRIEPVIVEEDKLRESILRFLDGLPGGMQSPADLDYLDFTAIGPEQGEEQEEQPETPVVDETPIMRFVNKILLDAIRVGASDIHIENYEHHARIRFREDGQLREITRPPLQVARKIGARLKVMASLDISEKRHPQDGRFKLNLSRSRAIDFRVSTLPTLWGEKTVLRVLDSEAANLDLDSLGFSNDQKPLYKDALHRQQGLILITGPTGSGKSRSLYAGLSSLNTRDRNIASVEDPVEIHLDGINQVAVNPATGLDFADALRAFLRQDPDVIMVGEIRDLETAQIAVRASQTGHLVMSTLHTNSAPETLSRLADMGIARFQLASALTLIIAQRLARRLCNYCKKPLHLPRKVLIQEGFSPDQLENPGLFDARGCERCHAGYKGMVGIFEVVPITGSISRAIINGENSMEIADLAANAGFNSLRISALEKAAQGITSLTEVNRVTWPGNQADKPVTH